MVLYRHVNVNQLGRQSVGSKIPRLSTKETFLSSAARDCDNVYHIFVETPGSV